VGTRALLPRLCAAASLVQASDDLARTTSKGNYSKYI
jgi:hypothetical protein